ncbi:MarR family winged helix-turn-helix transcriptional regulator [Candidatus Desulfosporosinus nitrosoreducens]|uniref:MarR family winged helix-turn-helix transcriptional regulator n=1 Tax=Candidatus Desulfosporosinus nitrosoreducens TaxID=3401928 RepID=UPI00280B3653|nr:MarR family transcriptional regulator [Desulfosporosinus sp. PR]
MEKKTRHYGTDVPIFPSEINMLGVIRENEGIHITGLAEKLGVTKGAVSQILMKLQKKGLIEKTEDSRNTSKLVVTLTPKGKKADANHMKFHEKLDSLMDGLLKNATEENKLFLQEFLNGFATQMGSFEEGLIYNE